MSWTILAPNSRDALKPVRDGHGKVREFSNRQKARQFCRNHFPGRFEEVFLVSPDGEREKFDWTYYWETIRA
jgi:hypothetical protein